MPAPVQPVAAPPPALPSASQIWARVRQVAQAESISVPLAASPPFDVAGTAPQFRALLGAWGPGVWQGNPAGDKAILVIGGADSDGNLRGVMGKSAGGSLPAAWTMATGTAQGGRFVLRGRFIGTSTNYGNVAVTSQVEWTFELRPDGTLAGSRENGASTIVLQRLQ